MEKLNNLSIDVKGPYRVSHMVIGSYRYVSDEENHTFKDRIVKGDNLAGDKELANIVALYTFGIGYEGDESLVGGNLLLPNIPTLDSLKIKVEDLDKEDVRTLYTKIVSAYYNLNYLRTGGDVNSEEGLTLGNCIANFYNRYIKNTYGFQPSVVKFDALDIKGMFNKEKEISPYYQKAFLDELYERNRGELDKDSKFTIAVTRPILSDRKGDIHEIKKMILTLYTPDTNPVSIIVTFRELTIDDINDLNNVKSFSHEVL